MEMIKEIIKLICSIALVICSVATSFSMGRHYFKENIFKLDFITKIKFILMISCPILLIYAAYVIYSREAFILATLISMLATVILIVCEASFKTKK